MKTRNQAWLTLVLPLLLAGCPGDGAGGGNGEGGVAPAIVYTANQTSNDISAFSVGTGGALTIVPSSGPNPNPAPVGTSPTAVTVSSNGQFLYVVNSVSNNVTAFTIGAGGVLTLVPSTGPNPNPVSVGTTPEAITLSPNGQFVFVANSGSNNVTAFTVGPGGVLTPVPSTGPNPNPVSVGTTPNGITVSPDNQFVYVVNRASNNVTGFTIGAGGALTPVPSSGPNPNPAPVGTTPTAATVSSGQFLYVANSGSNNVTAFTIGAGGVLTLVPSTGPNPNPVPVGTTPNGITVSPNGQFVYVANSITNDVTAFTIGAGGVLTLVPSTVGNPNPAPVAGMTPNGITVSPNGQFLYVANSASNDVTAFSIGGGGVLTFVPSTLTNLNPVSVGGSTPRGIASPGRP